MSAPNVIEKPRLPVSNTGEIHLACAVLVDTSSSMAGKEEDIVEGIRTMKDAIMEDDIARGRVEICLITFDSEVREVCPFGPVSRIEIPDIRTHGMTCTHAAVAFALKRVQERTAEYRSLGMTYKQPWIWLLTDGHSNDADNGAFQALLEAQNTKPNPKCIFYGVAIGDDVNEQELASMSRNSTILKVSKEDFMEAFSFISQSLSMTSRTAPGEDEDQTPPPEIQKIRIPLGEEHQQ